MDALEAAETTAGAVSSIGSHFMLDGATYAYGAGLGFHGLDFYVTGRGGALGEVDADVVAASFAFFEPGYVRAQWEQGRTVMPALEAADAFATSRDTWAEAHVPDDLDAARLAELAAAVATQARPACAPLFAAWRSMATPESPKAAAVHHLNVLRELRNAMHASCILAAGLAPLDAVSIKSPGMVPLFGWPAVAEVEGRQAAWEEAERNTTVAMAHAYEGLDDAGREELATLANALHDATKG